MNDLSPLFDALKAVMAEYSDHLMVLTDKPGNFYLECKDVDEKGKAIFFGMVKSGRGKVAYHLMPAYCEPSLLENISPELQSRVSGKSCFNFTDLDDALITELKELTRKGFESYQKAGKI